MKRYAFSDFSLDSLRLVDSEPPEPASHEIRLRVEAMSLNYRDVLVVEGSYNRRLPLPATPLSDASGVVTAVGSEVTDVKVGDRVLSHFVADWLDGPFHARYAASTLGLPGPGVASEEVVLPSHAVLPVPEGMSFTDAATLPIAALTAWSALVTEGNLQPGQRVLTLGTGGVSLFAVQLGKAMGAELIITSSSDEKLSRATSLGADHGINYRTNERWDKAVTELTGGEGVDIVVENGGVATLSQSLKSTRGGGIVALLGALTGLVGEVNIAPVIMKRVRIAGVLVDSKQAFAKLLEFLEKDPITPVIDREFEFGELADALRYMKSGQHFGKIVVRGT